MILVGAGAGASAKGVPVPSARCRGTVRAGDRGEMSIGVCVERAETGYWQANRA